MCISFLLNNEQFVNMSKYFMHNFGVFGTHKLYLAWRAIVSEHDSVLDFLLNF